MLGLGFLVLAAAQWVQVAEDRQDVIWLMEDPTSARREGDVITVWVKAQRPDENGYHLINMGFDCAGWRVGVVSAIYYGGDGNVERGRSLPDIPGSSIGYDPIAPDTVNDAIARTVCHR